MSSVWVLQLAGLLGGVRAAWLLQAAEVEHADAIEMFARTEFRDVLALARSTVPWAPIYRRDTRHAGLHEVFFSAEPLDAPDSVLFDDGVRAALLNYPPGYQDALDAEARGEDTVTFFVVGKLGDGRPHALMTFRCTVANDAACAAHADALVRKWSAVLPSATFTVERRVVVSGVAALRRVRDGTASQEDIDTVYNELWNAGIDVDPPFRGLTDFERGVVWALGTYAHNDPMAVIHKDLPPDLRAKYDRRQQGAGAAVLAALTQPLEIK